MVADESNEISNNKRMKRSYAIDVFRGLTITAMILVNNPGTWNHMYAPLAHAEWHGWTMTDLIFPFFLIIVGVAISMSFGAGSKAQLERTVQLKEIALRALKLYGLGLFLALFFIEFHNPEFNWVDDRLLSVRLVGVLQRIAFVYFISSLIFLYVSESRHLLLFFGALVIYWLLMMLVPYPLPTGETVQGLLIPGNNLAAYIDHHMIGADHMYLKNTLPYASDPEGLLSTIPAVASCIGGFFIANILRNSQSHIDQIKQLLIMGMGSLVLAYIASIWIPFNKNLWTPSYVLLAQGLAGYLLALIVYVTELKNYRYGMKPFVVFGMNAIALFMLSGIVARILLMIRVDDDSLKGWLFNLIKQLPLSLENQSLIFAILFLVVMYVPLYWMYQKRIFWKV